MAGIDKTYIDGKEYPLYRQWWIDHYDEMIKEFGEPIWLYTFNYFDVDHMSPEFLINNTDDIKHYKYAYDFPIWNTSERQDKWLIKNCDIPSYKNRLLEVYSDKWKGFKGINIPKDRIKPKFKY